ncbi:MAG: cell division protein FtsQ/DivIB [Candidatus Kryptoniota bacterium]
MNKIEKTHLNFILTACLLAALYLTSQNWKKQLVLHDVKVYDASLLSDEEVKTLAGVQDGSALYGLSLAQISHRVESSPFVKQAVVVRALPYDLTITVHERNPIALLAMMPPAEMLSVDNNGVVLPLPFGRKNNLPVITGVTEELKVGDTVKGNLIQAVKFMCDADRISAALGADIAGVKLVGDNLIAYTTASSLPVIIGKGDLDRKLIYLQSFFKEDPDNSDPGYNYIDLRFDGQIVIGTHLVANSADSHAPSGSAGLSPAETHQSMDHIGKVK